MENFSSSSKCNFLNFIFTNCFRLYQKARSEISANSQSTIQLLTTKFREYQDQVRILFQVSEIPECFSDQKVGSSSSIQLPANWQQYEGIDSCIVFTSEDQSIDCRISRFTCECKFISSNNEHEDITRYLVYFVDDLLLYESDQVLLCYDPFIKEMKGDGCGGGDSAKEEDWFNKYSNASFQFYPQRWRKLQKHCKVKKCGVLII